MSWPVRRVSRNGPGDRRSLPVRHVSTMGLGVRRIRLGPCVACRGRGLVTEGHCPCVTCRRWGLVAEDLVFARRRRVSPKEPGNGASRVADGAWWPNVWSCSVRRVSPMGPGGRRSGLGPCVACRMSPMPKEPGGGPKGGGGGTKLLRTSAVSFIIIIIIIHHPEKETNIGGQESAGLPLSNNVNVLFGSLSRRQSPSVVSSYSSTLTLL